MPFIFSSFDPSFLNLSFAAFTSPASMFPKRNVPAIVPAPSSPDNKTSFNCFISFERSAVAVLLKAVFICGNMASMCLSTLRCICCALLTSADLSPICALSRSKNFCGLSPLGLNFDKILFITPLLSSKSFALFIPVFNAEPVAPTKPSNKELSNPNFILLNTSLAASSSVFGVKAVGPAPNISPIVPTCSGSPTNIASATPIPAAPPRVVSNLPFAFNASFILALSFLSFSLKYLFAFLETMACLAKLDPILKPCAPGIPRLVTIRARLPASVASAFSSNVVKSSKNFSTLAA